MHRNDRVLVVGTTSDYINALRDAYRGRLLFLTDQRVRRKALEPVPSDEEEALSNLQNHDTARRALRGHIAKWGLHIRGIACYDCESMLLSAEIASEYSLSYPSAESIGRCRSKYVSKTLWKQQGLRCPEAEIVRSPEDAAAFLDKHDGICVLKPVTGTGSELVALCRSREECESAFDFISAELLTRSSTSLYNRTGAGSPDVIAEQYVGGTEYSCDFIARSGRAEVIRITGKISRPQAAFGTTMAYVLESKKTCDVDAGRREDVLGRAALALGIDNALCMVDFKIVDGDIMLLELTPRPGGDCIPNVMRHASGTDTRLLMIDMAMGKTPRNISRKDGIGYVGLRMHAERAGTVDHLDATALEKDPRVLEVDLYRRPGHRVIMPPDDYDSWLLGHVIFRAAESLDVKEQCKELLGKLDCEIGNGHAGDVRET